MATEYVRADNVLPPKVLTQVQKYYTGLVYVPASREFYRRRRREVLSLHKKGLPTDVIAERVHLCRRRVQQIVREEHCPPTATDKEGQRRRRRSTVSA